MAGQGQEQRRILLTGAAVLVLVTGLAFAQVTTFIGDDHLFLAFARYAANPWSAFVHDQHGGEFYRPLPMLLWWLLGRLGGGSRLPFVALSFALHLATAIEVGVLVRALRPGQPARAALFAAALFFLSPVTQEAAFWFSASTDLLATALGLGAVIAVLRGHPGRAALLGAAAYWSKESALVLPLLAVLALLAQQPRRPIGQIVKYVGPLAVVAALYAGNRTLVLKGLGQAGDPPAALGGKLIQIISGLAHLVSGQVIAHEGIAWTIGIATWIALLVGGSRSWRRGQRDGGVPIAAAALAWVVVAALPLLAAPWVVGARYFYLPAVGVAWLAGTLLAGAPMPVAVGVLAMLAGLDLAQDLGRHADIQSYQARVTAARRAVADGLDHGFNTFHIAAGVKDLDLAVKEDLAFADHEADLVVLDDVPASFVALPELRAGQLEFLLAQPPLPPTGAYRFGARRIVGLARRGDDPTLDEVTARLPAIRFIRLRTGPGGRIVARDVTDSLNAGSDDESPPE